jgi:quinol monooxygenase YgiN
MLSVGLLVVVEARPGKEQDVESFLREGQPLAQQEPGTVAWFAVRLGDGRFGIVDFFPDDAARQAHLSGQIGQALSQRADELFSKPPSIEQLDVVAEKLPG